MFKDNRKNNILDDSKNRKMAIDRLVPPLHTGQQMSLLSLLKEMSKKIENLELTQLYQENELNKLKEKCERNFEDSY